MGAEKVTDAVDDAAEAIANVGEAIEEAREEAREEIIDAAERAETMGQFDALNARLSGIESKLAAGDVPPAVQSQLDEIRVQLSEIAERVGGSTGDAVDDAIEEVDDAAEAVNDATDDAVAEVAEPIEDAAESIEDATEIEQAPRRAHVLFRKLGRGD